MSVKQKPVIRAIVGALWVGSNLVISRNGQLPLQSKADLAFFRKMTMGGIVVMGSRTWASLPEQQRPLPGRTCCVLSNRPSKGFLTEDELVNTNIKHLYGIDTPEKLKERLEQINQSNVLGNGDIWIIGGKQLYEFAAPIVDEWYITHQRTEIDTPYDLALQAEDVAFISPTVDDEFRLVARVSIDDNHVCSVCVRAEHYYEHPLLMRSIDELLEAKRTK